MLNRYELEEMISGIRIAYKSHFQIVYTSFSSTANYIEGWKTDLWACALHECMKCFRNSCDEEESTYLYNSLSKLDWPSVEVFPLNKSQEIQIGSIVKLFEFWGCPMQFNANAFFLHDSYMFTIFLDKKAVEKFTEIENEINTTINPDFGEAVRDALNNQKLRILIRNGDDLVILTEKVSDYRHLESGDYTIQYKPPHSSKNLSKILVEVQNSFGQSSYNFIDIEEVQANETDQ